MPRPPNPGGFGVEVTQLPRGNFVDLLIDEPRQVLTPDEAERLGMRLIQAATEAREKPRIILRPATPEDYGQTQEGETDATQKGQSDAGKE